jgi:NAD+ diphosphatase
MFGIKEPMDFISRIAPPTPPDDEHAPAHWFVFQDDKLLVRPAGDAVSLPLVADVTELGVTLLRALYLGYLHETPGRRIDCYAAEIALDSPLPDGMTAEGLRQVYTGLGETLWTLAGRAVQIVTWDRTHQYCGQCGTPSETLPHERAKRCPRCGLITYPRLSPAIIIAVVRRTEDGPRLLLARNHRFPTGRYSVLAGYVEPGETLEECARREVLEEVGVQIANVRYFGSQPWPFPNSLMIGFTAEYVGGELTLEEAEIADARWFAANALPEVPPKMTIARRLIDWFVNSG